MQETEKTQEYQTWLSDYLLLLDPDTFSAVLLTNQGGELWLNSEMSHQPITELFVQTVKN